MRFWISVVLLFTSFVVTSAQTPVSPTKYNSTTYKHLLGKDFVLSKNYYLLALFQEIAPVRKLLQADSVLVRLGRSKLENASNSATDCGTARLCYIDNWRFSDEEIVQVGKRLAALYSSETELQKLITDHLIPTGCYGLYADLPPSELLVKAWEQDAKGVNYTIGVYGNGDKPNYPLIDSISFSVHSSGYPSLLRIVSESLRTERDNESLFFELSLGAALRLLEVNGREQAADFEPMSESVNQSTIEKLKTVDWAKYPYTLILVLGSGASDYSTALSGEGKMRLRIAAESFKKGLAPVMVVSGGRVHPYKTKYCEAEEMKKYLTEKLGIPSDAVLMDPHARHTTTNVRNTARMIFRYGLPADKPSLVSSASNHISMVMSKAFDERCMKELHLIPFKKGKRLSPNVAEFFPSPIALQINPTEPLDP